MSLELRHLRTLVAVAEELSFTRAAERLHMAQQALSKQISQLEARVGVQLVERTTRKVELTPAGHALVEHARGLLADSERALAAAREAGGVTPVFTVGFVVPADHEPMRPVLELFAERRPDVDLRVHFGDVLDLAGGLQAGHADVAVVVGEMDTTGLVLEPLWSDPRGVAVAADHELASKSEVTIEELLELPSFDFPAPDPIGRDYWGVVKERRGRPARIVAQFRSLDGLLEAIRAGLGGHVIRERIVDSLGPSSGVVFRPVPELEPAVVSLARKENDRREVVAEFVEAARAIFPQAAGSTS